MPTLPRPQPLTVTVDDFVITTQLLERKCELHYELTLKRPRVGEAWEIEQAHFCKIVRALPNWNAEWGLWHEESNHDLKLELIAYITDDDASFQRLQDAANNEIEEGRWL